MTLDIDLWRKAAAACAVAAPHREAGEDWPCSRCLLLSASANAPSTGVVCPPCPGGGALGAAGQPGPPPVRLAAPPSTKPRFDDDGEWDANGWERVPTWERRPR